MEQATSGVGKMKYAIKGINGDTDTCACCGKTNLKRVVWLAPLDVDGSDLTDPSAYGTTCAGRLLGVREGTTKAKTERFIEQRYTEEVKDRVSNAVWSLFRSDDWLCVVFAPLSRHGAVVAGADQRGGTFVPRAMWLDMTRNGVYSDVYALLEAVNVAYPVIGAYRQGKYQLADQYV